MAKKNTSNTSVEELLGRATANGYRSGAHKMSDGMKDHRKYVKKTLKDQA